MRRYIITGAPGAGKTTLLEALQDRGYAVVDEAATDVPGRGGGNASPGAHRARRCCPALAATAR